MVDTDKILWINPVGGLANRMRFMAGGIALAISLGVDYRIVWLENWELGARFDDLFVETEFTRGKILYPTSWEYALKYSVPRKKNLYITSLTDRCFGECIYVTDPLWTDSRPEPEKNEILESRIKEGFSRKRRCYIQGGYDLWQYSDEFFRSLFHPVAEIATEVEKELKSLGPERIGMHIRRSDNALSIERSGDRLFEEVIEAKLAESPTVKIYLASDDMATKYRLLAKYGDRIATDCDVVERDSREGMCRALKEMSLLANMPEIYGSFYSSYSEIAARLGGASLKILTRE